MAVNDPYNMFKKTKSTVKSASNAHPKAFNNAAATNKTDPFDLGTAYDNNQKMKYRQQGIDALKPPDPFKLDMESIQSDPTYQAAMQSAKEATQVAEGDISAALNRRGIMDSTINANAAANAAQAEYGRVNRELLPGLIEDQYKRYIDQANMKRQNALDLFGVSEMYGNDEQQAFNNAITEAGITGNYLSPEARGIANQLVKLGEAWKTGTPEQKAAYHDQANKLRARLSGLGVDPSLFGANVSTEGRLANISKAGVRTLAGEAQDYNQAADTMDRTFNQGITMAELTGYLPNGKKTTAEEQRFLENQWMLSEQLGVISPELAKLYGIPANTPTQAARQWADSNALNWAQHNLNVQQEDRIASNQSSGGGSGGSGGSGAGGSEGGMSSTDFDRLINQIDNSTFMTKDFDGRPVVYDKRGLVQYILSAGLTDPEVEQLFSRYNINTEKALNGEY